MRQGLQIIRIVCALGVLGAGLYTLAFTSGGGLQDRWSVLIPAIPISSGVWWIWWELSRGP
jgi:hypothetical protein